MPELPEVETVRRTLADRLIGLTVERVTVRRADIITGSQRGLRRGGRIVELLRQGKQLAMRFQDGRCVCIHLGMSGSLIFHKKAGKAAKHEHIIWHLDKSSRLIFRDPRRFGGLWVFDSCEQLIAQRWSRLGTDALTITPAQLASALGRTRRAIKAALLDQTLIAGLGNIYVDEVLFACGIWPEHRADRLHRQQVQLIVRKTRTVLRHAIAKGGSTLRSYVDGEGKPGGFQSQHKVYGRADQPCATCATPLKSLQIAGRTTVACRVCQKQDR
jgi:formamidopyrimidine-DNA glycosylase